MIVIHRKQDANSELEKKLNELRNYHSVTTMNNRVVKELKYIRDMVHKWAWLSDNDPNTTGMDEPSGFIPEKANDFFFNSPDLVKWQTLFTKTPASKAYGFSDSIFTRYLMRRIGLITGKLKDIFKLEIIGGVRNDLPG